MGKNELSLDFCKFSRFISTLTDNVLVNALAKAWVYLDLGPKFCRMNDSNRALQPSPMIEEDGVLCYLYHVFVNAIALAYPFPKHQSHAMLT